ncbi:hypothetical protein Tco_0071597 [Tanacetum coccineum]
MYHKKNLDYAYLLWEDFVYQVKNKNVKRSNEMYYPRFTKVIVNFFMTKDQSIPRRNKGMNLQYNKASVKKKQARSNKTKTHPTAKGKRLKTSTKLAKHTKKKQPTKTSKAKGLTVLSKVALTEAEQIELATGTDNQPPPPPRKGRKTKPNDKTRYGMKKMCKDKPIQSHRTEKSKSSQLNKLTVKTGAVIEEYLLVAISSH